MSITIGCALSHMRNTYNASKGRNGTSKLVSDWELWTTHPTDFYHYRLCPFSHEEHIHTYVVIFWLNILNIFCDFLQHILWALFENPSIHPDITDIMNPSRANLTLDQVSESHEIQKADRKPRPNPDKSSCRITHSKYSSSRTQKS